MGRRPTAAEAVADHFQLGTVAVSSEGVKQLATRLGVDKKKVAHNLHLHAAISLSLWLTNLPKSIRTMCLELVELGGRCMTLFEGLRLNETPMTMGVIDAPTSLKLLGTTLEEFSKEELAAWHARCQDNAVFKLLQN